MCSPLRDDVQHRSVPGRASKTARSEKPMEEVIDLGELGSGRSHFEVRLDLGGGVPFHVVRS